MAKMTPAEVKAFLMGDDQGGPRATPDKRPRSVIDAENDALADAMTAILRDVQAADDYTIIPVEEMHGHMVAKLLGWGGVIHSEVNA